MITVMIISIIVVLVILALSVMSISKGYSYKHTIDTLPEKNKAHKKEEER